MKACVHGVQINMRCEKCGIDRDSPARRRMRETAPMRRAVAIKGHYFWLPCPLCGTEFAGYEWGGDNHSIYAPGSNVGTGICPACTDEGRGNG